MMRDYYFIGQVADTEYGFSVEDLLHYGACHAIKLYVHISETFTLCNRKYGETREDSYFFLRLNPRQIIEVEKTHARNALSREHDSPLLTPEKFAIKAGYLDNRYMGDIPIWHGFETDDEEIEVAFDYANHTTPYFAKSEIICFTEDLKNLKARHERIEHIAKYGRQSLASEQPELATTERNSLYKMILGMAMEKYDYDPESRRNSATGENTGSISADLEKAGLPVDADTIREHLKAAFAATPPEKN